MLFNDIVSIIQFNENKIRMIADRLEFQSHVALTDIQIYNDNYYYPATTEKVDSKIIDELLMKID